VEDGHDKTLVVNSEIFKEIKCDCSLPTSETYKDLLFRAVSNDALNSADPSFTFIDSYHEYGKDLFFSRINGLTPNYEQYGKVVNIAASYLKPVDFALKIVRWRETSLHSDNLNFANNSFEHRIGTFLMGQKYDSFSGALIANANEVQNLRMDFANNNVMNAIEAKGGTAFEWKDVYNNMVGYTLSIHYSATKFFR